MSRHSEHRSTAALLVLDDQGCYLPATPDQILHAARHAIDQKMRRGAAFDSPEAVKDYLLTKLAGFEHEVFSVLFLDSGYRLIDYVEMFRGSLSQTSVHPREVVKEALRLNAAAVILAHNHPSGDPSPSWADQTLTFQLKSALEIVEVRVVDHIIVAGALTSSFAELDLL